MKPICIIPARAGSKGVKGKNIRNLNGKPLISYAIKSALESKFFSHVFVSTEDKKISNIAKKYGAEIPFLRPKKLASDNSDISDTLYHTIKKLESEYDFDSVMLRDCTCPFIDYDDMKKVIFSFKKNNCDSVYSGVLAHPNPYFGMGELNSKQYIFTPKKLKRIIYRRQDAPKVFNLDGIVIFDSKKFLKTKKLLTNKSKIVEITKEHGHMIDFEFDFTVAELLMKNKSR
ncbi:MAG: N-acylneuraminate cytidylyltransferase [Nitrospina sp.]|nr:N-acylneuraminate cytidylyltransferase [Nitrospina sp.]|tara:strand:- start:626 stop:1315 length:690 start_codon:yes stop_codon:yes gene_type:complete